MHIICMTYAGRMPAPQLFSIFGLYDLAAHQLNTPDPWESPHEAMTGLCKPKNLAIALQKCDLQSHFS
jgi:hypothetical protein